MVEEREGIGGRGEERKEQHRLQREDRRIGTDGGERSRDDDGEEEKGAATGLRRKRLRDREKGE